MSAYIENNWREYFRDHHEGLGTTYERFILHKFFENLKQVYSVNKILEAPSFGMTGVTGINSMWWAEKRVEVHILDNHIERIKLLKQVWDDVKLEMTANHYSFKSAPLPYADNYFDLAWNFAALNSVSNLEFFLDELSRVTKKALFICIPNQSSVFYKLDPSNKKDRAGEIVPVFNMEKIDLILRKSGWQSVQHGFLDTPPWPDIAMKKEDFLKKIGFGFLVPEKSEAEGPCLTILDYFNGKNRAMERDILKYSFLENSPGVFQKYWSHHEFMIFEPGDK